MRSSPAAAWLHPWPDDGENLRRALLLSRGSPSVFLERPISATMLVLSLILLIILAMPAIRKKRDETFVED